MARPAASKHRWCSTPLAVEIRLKGNVRGSFRTLDGKAAFKLKFKQNRTPSSGCSKMTLNNMVEDPSMIHETLAYTRLPRAPGCRASRTGFAYVRLNGEDFGVYLNLENLDEVALANALRLLRQNTQHLYEGEDAATDVDARAEQADFEVDEGDEERPRRPRSPDRRGQRGEGRRAGPTRSPRWPTSKR